MFLIFRTMQAKMLCVRRGASVQCRSYGCSIAGWLLQLVAEGLQIPQRRDPENTTKKNIFTETQVNYGPLFVREEVREPWRKH